jgi:hypothetical protein
VTTATLLVVDAVRAALSNLDGDAQHHQHAVHHRFALKFVETGTSKELNSATMATREMVMGATQHARSSADSSARTKARVRQLRLTVETARSLATRHVTTATLMVGMDAVRTAP